MRAFQEKIDQLKNFVGGMACIWFYTATFLHLAIQIRQENSEEIIFLLFYECERIELNVAWRFAIPKIEILDERLICVTDEKAEMRIVCSHMRVKKDYKPPDIL